MQVYNEFSLRMQLYAHKREGYKQALLHHFSKLFQWWNSLQTLQKPQAYNNSQNSIAIHH